MARSACAPSRVAEKGSARLSSCVIAGARHVLAAKNLGRGKTKRNGRNLELFVLASLVGMASAESVLEPEPAPSMI